MKFYFFFLILIFSLPMHAQFYEATPSYSVTPLKFSTAKNETITAAIKINGFDKTLSCELDSSTKNYLCPNNNNPILIKRTELGFTAIGRDDQKNPITINLSNAKTNGKTLYEVQKISLDPNKPLVKDLNSNLNEQISTINNFFELNPYAAENTVSERKIGSENYEKIAKAFIQDKERLKTEIGLLSHNKNYKVELGDGQVINCERENERSKDQAQSCGSFKCENAKIEGKSYQTVMIFNSDEGIFAHPTIHLIDENGIGPNIITKKVFASQSPIPFKDNAFDKSDEDVDGNKLIDNLDKSITHDREKISVFTNEITSRLIDYYEARCAENSPALTALINAKKKLMSPMANVELVEFIKVLGDGTLVGEYLNPTKAMAKGCFYQGVYLDKEAAKNLKIIKKNINPDKHVNETISLDRANKLFQKAKNMKDIPWGYKQDGCYARAHLMAKRFEAEGVRVDKVWIKGRLAIPEESIVWNFHVAPIVYVKDQKGQIQKMVIDPSMFDRPVTVDEWDKKITKNTTGGTVRTVFPFPENSAMMERASLAFSTSDPYMPATSIKMTEKEKLDQANETMKQYRQVEQP